MANDVVSLLKIQLSEELRLGAIARRGNGSRDALTYLMSVVLVAVVFGFMMHMFMDSLASAGYAEHVPLLTAFISMSAALGMSFFRGSHAFVFSDYDLIMSMPIRSSDIALSRFLSVYLMGAAVCLYLSSIGIATTLGQLSLASAVMFLVAMLIGALIPASIGTALGTVITRVGSNSSNRGTFSIISLIAIVVLIVVLMEFMTGASGGDDVLQSLVGIVSTYCPPATWVSGWVDADARSMAMLLIASIASSAFVVVVASVFLRILNSETAPSNRKISKSESHSRGCLYAMYRRDLRRYVSSRVYVTNTAIGMLLLVVLSYLIGYSDSLDSSDGLGQIMPYLASSLPFFVSFFIVTSSTTAVSLSMEGFTRWILGTAPLRPWDIFLSKILVNLTLIVPMEFLSIVILATGMGVSGIDLILLIAVPTAYALFIPALGMAMNIRYPRYDWSSEYYAVKGGSVSMLGTLGIGLGSVMVPLFVSAAFDGLSTGIMAVVAVAVLIAAAGLYSYLGGRSCISIECHPMSEKPMTSWKPVGCDAPCSRRILRADVLWWKVRMPLVTIPEEPGTVTIGCRRYKGCIGHQTLSSSALMPLTYSATYGTESLPCSAMILTMAEPTMAPSAKSVILLACSGVDIPNPIAQGMSVALLTAATMSSRLELNDVRTPVTPMDDTM